MFNAESQQVAAKLLRWYADMGVDEAVGDEPLDWFAWSQRMEENRVVVSRVPLASPDVRQGPGGVLHPRAASRKVDAPPPVAPDEAALAARDLAARAQSLSELSDIVSQFDGCALKTTAKNTCFKRGADDARIMLIGEGPGRDEDLQGLPFVGRAGQLLDRMLGAVGFSEEDIYITNIVYWRPPGNRTPTPQEVQACAPFLERQIELLDPSIIVLIGAPSSHHILDTTQGITRIRGTWKQVQKGGKERTCMPILHPAYLLRTPAAKRLAWRDMLAIRDKYDELEPEEQVGDQ